MSRAETSRETPIFYVTRHLFIYVGHQMRGSAQDVGVNPGKPFILPLTNHFELPIFRSLHSHSAAPFGFYVGHHFEIPGTPSCIIARLLPSNGWRIWILAEIKGEFGKTATTWRCPHYLKYLQIRKTLEWRLEHLSQTGNNIFSETGLWKSWETAMPQLIGRLIISWWWPHSFSQM